MLPPPLRSTFFLLLSVGKRATGCVASYESDNEFEWQEMPRAHRAKSGHEEANRIFGWLVDEESDGMVTAHHRKSSTLGRRYR